MNTTNQKESPRAWYALRRTLPPWRFDELLDELVRCLPRYGVDEVIVKVDTEEFSHGQPPLPWVRKYQKNLFRIKEAMDSLEIAFSINPWITLCHNDRGRDGRAVVPGLRTIVGHDGVTCTACACPISRAWRDHVAKVWTLYAKTRPHVIWIEDDIRTFNHAPARFGCFCPEHMKLFSRRVGRKVTRQQLVTALLKPGRPHPWRKAWLDLQGEVMIDTVAFLAKVVHAASPETHLGLMSSGPRNHCLEGRRWNEFAEALADGRTLYSRPPMGNYHEGSLRGFYYSHDSIKLTRLCLPPDTIEQTEVENVPFTLYSNSVNFTFIETAVSFAFGCQGVTMNLFDHCGTPMENDPNVGAMLAAKKPFLNALAEVAQQAGSYRGVRLPFSQKTSYVKRLVKGVDYGALAADGHAAMEMLESFGIPTTYEPSGVTALTGQTTRALSDEEIREILFGGVYLDGAAAMILAERGFGKLIGLRSIREPKPMHSLGAFSAEEIIHPQFAGKKQKYVSACLPHLGGNPLIAIISPETKAQIVTRLVDPDTKPHWPLMTAFENTLGGRVVVHAWTLENVFGPAFLHPFRRELMHAVMNWLARGEPPVLVSGGGVYPLALRKDVGRQTLLGCFNLTLDVWSFVEWQISDGRKVAGLQFLSPDGRWESSAALKSETAGRNTVVRYEAPVPYDQPLFVTVHWA